MTSTIILKTDSKLKTDAQKIAADLGISLSTVINNYLKSFVREKSFFASKKARIKPELPYGIFKNANISEKDIDEVTSSWDKIIDELA